MRHSQLSAPPPAFVCPISHELMEDTVFVADGHTYERKDIARWLSNSKRTSPLTNGQLLDTLPPFT